MTSTTDTLLAAVQTAHAAATNKWAGREWDDGGNTIEPHMSDETIVSMLRQNDASDLRVTSWGIPDDGSHMSQIWRRNVQTTAEDLARATTDEAVHEACEVLRDLGKQSDRGVRRRAEAAEEAAQAALDAAIAGDFEEAAMLAGTAASIEREFGDDPTWGPFAAAVRMWAESAAVDQARAAYLGRFDSRDAAFEFETSTLSMDREFLSAEAEAVVDGGEATVEYYDWLIDQIDESEAA